MTPSRRTPREAWLATLRSLCRFAVKRGWLRADPTANIKLRAIKGDGFHTWTEDEIAQFEAHHPIGTKPRLAFALLLYTAQRRSDVVRMGRQHINDGVLTVKQQKTGVTLGDPGASGIAHGARRHAERASDVPGHRDRQAVRRQRFQRAVSKLVRRRWITEALLGAWAAQGGMPPTRGSRMLSQRDHEHQRTRDDERGRRYTKAADQARLARNALAKAVIR